MGNYDPHINIDHILESRDGYFNIKEIEIEHSSLGKIETPFKVLDGKRVNEYHANLIKNIIDKPIFESWNSVNQLKSFNSLYKIIRNPDKDKKRDQIVALDDFFKIRKRLWNNSFTTISLTFQRNPFQASKFKKGSSIPLTWDDYEFLLDYIHSASSAFILVPDIRLSEVFNLNDYIEYVDQAVSILSDFNNKAIFVPVPIKLDRDDVVKLIKHYKSEAYTNLWVNFNASQISSTQFTRLRFLLRNIEKYLKLNRTTLYFSHVKKEINKHILDKKTVASNALAPFFGSDFLGITREPPGFEMNEEDELNYITKNKFENKEEYEHAKVLNKTRIFDPKTYYYYNLDVYPQELPIPVPPNNLQSDHINRMINSVILNKEIDYARNFIEIHKNVRNYAKQKAALMNESEILDNIIPRPVEQSKILEFFSNYKK